MRTHFQVKIEEAIQSNKDALVSAPRGDSHLHAELKGRHLGLVQALTIYRDAMKADIEFGAAA